MRVMSIDVLRGVAILGILVMNIPYHAHLILGYVPFEPALFSDHVITLIYSVFADGRFRTLFCLLFGAGLAIQYASCEKKGINTALFLKSRLYWLLLFGFIHAVFIFGGDILMLYSITGLFFLKGLSLEHEVLLARAKKFLLIGSVLALLFAVLGWVFNEPNENVIRGSSEFVDAIESWSRNYMQHTMTHAGFALLMLLVSPIFVFWQVLGLMYLGAYLYKTQFFTYGFSQAVFNKIMLWGVVSTLFCVVPQILDPSISTEVIPLLSSISAIFVALIYAHIVVKLCHSPSILLRWLAVSGKLAFTLYILQSIAMGLLLRWGYPAFIVNATQLDYLLIFVCFTVIQIAIANLYLHFFKQGPLEALWRKAYNV